MIGLIMAAAIAVEAGKNKTLEPASVWRVDLTDESCVLSRSFGMGDSQIRLSIMIPPLGARTQVLMESAPGGGTYHDGSAKIVLSPSGLSVDGVFKSGPVADGNHRLTIISVDPLALANLGNSTTIAIAPEKERNVSIAPTAIAAGLRALDECDKKLMMNWGVDPEEPGKVAQAAKGQREGEWIKFEDYPASAIRSGQQGTSYIIWTIMLDGRAHDCKTIVSSGSPVLDTAACDAILLRARYAPAIGKDGKPMISHKLRKVTWTLPGPRRHN